MKHSAREVLVQGLPAHRIPFSGLTTLFGVSRATLQRKYRPGAKDPVAHADWARALDIRMHRMEGHGATQYLLHCSRERCEEHAARLQGDFVNDELAV